MDRRLVSQTTAIGVFDSGIGGLSVLKAVRAQLPHHELVYVADSGYAPYGDRSLAFIEDRAQSISHFLVDQGVAALVIACNTASVVAAHAVRAWSPVPVVAMEPAIKPAALASRSGVVGVLATTRTLASDNVIRLVSQFSDATRVLLQACPGLVEQVEIGELDSPKTRTLLKGFIQPLLDEGMDTLVLGCTHYPFLLPQIEALTGPTISIIDPAPAVARELQRRLSKTTDSVIAVGTQLWPVGRERFYCSGSLPSAQASISRLWHPDIHVEILPQRSPAS